MSDSTTSQISGILDQVRLLKSKYDELAAVTGEQFNVFSILGVEADEVRTHSPFLANLLDPQGSHRQGAAFLELFLELEELKSSKSGEYKNPETFRVSKEASTDQGQIDILLENEEACIVIENKIYAGDQYRQLARYYEAAKKRGPEKRIELVYLTLDGSPPSDDSLDGLPIERVTRLSYSKHIIDWLEDCMKLQEVQRVSPIREIVFQYRDLLKQLTGQYTNKGLSVDMKNILVKNKNYELIPELEKMILEFRVHTQLKFWDELADRIPKAVDNSCVRHNQSKGASESEIRHYYQGGRNRLYLGTTFRLDSFFWKQTEIALRIELGDGGRVYYGFVLFEDSRSVETCDNTKYDMLAEKLSGNDFKRTKWWIGWKYPRRRDFKFPLDYSGENRKHLQDDGSRAESIRELVTEIAEAVTQLKRNLNQS